LIEAPEDKPLGKRELKKKGGRGKGKGNFKVGNRGKKRLESYWTRTGMPGLGLEGGV